MMSGVEWTVVTVVGVCLIVLFVTLEVLFPAPDASDPTARDRMEEGDMVEDRPAMHPRGSHTLL